MQISSSPDRPIQKWETLSSATVLPEPWFRVRKDEIKLPSGTVIDDYLVWESPTIVTTVPITADGKFVLCQQYRHAVNEIMYQFPAGGMNKGETTEEAALRELEEETGYKATSVEFLNKVAAFPTKATGLELSILGARCDAYWQQTRRRKRTNPRRSKDARRAVGYDSRRRVSGLGVVGRRAAGIETTRRLLIRHERF